MKKISLMLVFVLALVMLLAFSTFAADRNVASEADISVNGNDWGSCIPEYWVDGKDDTTSMGPKGWTWFEAYFDYDELKTFTELKVVVGGAVRRYDQYWYEDFGADTFKTTKVTVNFYVEQEDGSFTKVGTTYSANTSGKPSATFADLNVQATRIAIRFDYGGGNYWAPYEVYAVAHESCEYTTRIQGENDRAVTCLADGYETYQCYGCANTQTRTISAPGHVYDNGVETLAPSYEAPGVLTFTCTKCDELGCTDCENYQYTREIPQLGHNWDEGTVTPPTCTAKGYTTFTCTDEGCGETKVENYTDIIPHDYTMEVLVKPTVHNEGEAKYTCECGDSYTETLEKLTWGDSTTVIGSENVIKYDKNYTAAEDPRSNPADLFDGIVNKGNSGSSPPYDGWWAPNGSELLITLDKEYYVVSFEFSVWSNYHSPVIQLLNSEKEVIKEQAYGGLSNTSPNNFMTAEKLVNVEGVKYIKVIHNTRSAEGVNCAFQEFRVTVHNCTVAEEDITNIVPATCTTKGSRNETCSVCGLTSVVESAALGHTGGEATCTVAAVCETCGEYYGDTLPHTEGTAATCTKAAVCSVCEQSYGDALGHDMSEATCASAAKCSRCDYTEGDALDHVEGTPATCTTKAVCSLCNQEYGDFKHGELVDLKCSVCNKYVVTTLDELKSAMNKCSSTEKETIVLGADIKPGYGNNNFFEIVKPITLDFAGHTLEIGAYQNGIRLNHPECALISSVGTGTFNFVGNVAAVKLFNADTIQNININVMTLQQNNKITGISIQLATGATSAHVNSIKNVRIEGQGLSVGFETYQCGSNADLVINEMENVYINATYNGKAGKDFEIIGMTLQAPCGTFTNCTVTSAEEGVRFRAAANWRMTGTFVNCQVTGGTHGLNMYSEGDISSTAVLAFKSDANTTFTCTSNPEKSFTAALNGAIDNIEVEISGVKMVAYIDGQFYGSFEEAYAVVPDGGTLQILADVELVDSLVINKKITLDLNKYTVSAPNGKAGDGVFHVVAGGELTIKGNGTVNGVCANEAGYHMAIFVNGGKVVIEGGRFTNVGENLTDDQYDLIYVKGGELVINGGTFIAQTPKWTLNLHDKTPGSIVVNAGSFYAYNPSASESENPVANFVVDNKCAVLNDNGYYDVINHVKGGEWLYDAENYRMVKTCVNCSKVMEKTAVVAKINGIGYASLEAAVAVGGEITLEANIDLATAVVINNIVTINLNGKTLTVSKDTEGNGVFWVKEGGVLTINGEGTVNGVCESEYDMAIWADGGSVVINGGTFTNVGAGEDDQYDLIYVKNGGSVVINGGTFIAQTPKWTLNAKDNDGSTIVVNGGKFYAYNPSASTSENPAANFVTEGKCLSLNNEGYYVVANHKAEVIEAVAPTCLATGLTAGSKCSVCGETLVAQTEVAKLDHNYVPVENEDGSITYTCQNGCNDSYVINNALVNGEYYLGTDLVVFNNGVLSAMGGEFTYTYNVTTGMITTDDEGLFFQMIEGTIHYRGRLPLHTHAVDVLTTKVTNPTCTDKGYTTYICTTCGPLYDGNYVDATGHSYGSMKIEQPTCTEDGYLQITCRTCEKTFVSPSPETDAYIDSQPPFITITIKPATGHTAAEAVQENVQNATCTAAGSYESVVYCSVCEAELSRKTETVNAIGHKWTDATCTAPKTCSVCKATEGEALGHNYGTGVVNANSVIFTCTACGTTKEIAHSKANLGETQLGYDDGAVDAVYYYIEISEAGTVTIKVDEYAGIKLGINPEALSAQEFMTGENAYTFEMTEAGRLFIVFSLNVYEYDLPESFEVSFEAAPTCEHINKVKIPAVPSVKGQLGSTSGEKCADCGEITTEPKQAAGGFGMNAALSVGEDISVLFKATVPSDMKNIYMVFTFLNEESTYTKYTTLSDGKKQFKFDKTMAKYMGDNIVATVYATDAEGYESAYMVPSYSVMTYCINQLKSATASQKVKQAVSDMLVLGAANQVYSNYKTNELVTDLVEAQGYTILKNSNTTINSIKNIAAVTGDRKAGIDFKNGGLILGNTVKVKLIFESSISLDGIVAKVTSNGETFEYNLADVATVTEVKENNITRYEFTLTQNVLMSKHYDSVITGSFYDANGNQIGSTITYSVNSYLARNYDSNTMPQKAKDLMMALYNFGESIVKMG